MSATDDDSGEDYVGYRHPPRHGRFKKGQSGNPAGRKKGSRNVASALMAAANEIVTVVENGRRVKITKLEAATKQLMNKAASGDLRASKTIIDMITQAEVRQDAKAPETISPAERRAEDAAMMQSLRGRLLDHFEGEEE